MVTTVNEYKMERLPTLTILLCKHSSKMNNGKIMHNIAEPEKQQRSKRTKISSPARHEKPVSVALKSFFLGKNS